MDSFLTTLEKEVFHVVQDDAVYSIFKNYLDLTNNRRIYVMVNKERESDVYEEAIVEDEEGTTE